MTQREAGRTVRPLQTGQASAFTSGRARFHSRQAVTIFRDMEVPGQPERDLRTTRLVSLAMDQVKHLARAEMLHAKLELKQDLAQGVISAGFGIATIVFVSAGVAALFLTGGFALPLVPWASALVTAGALFLLALICAAIAWFRIPKDPLHRTRKRLSEDLEEMQEHLRH